MSFLDSRLEIIFRVFRDFRGLKELLRFEAPRSKAELSSARPQGMSSLNPPKKIFYGSCEYLNVDIGIFTRTFRALIGNGKDGNFRSDIL